MGKAINWHRAVPLTAGAVLSVPAAAWTVRVLPGSMLRRAIGYATVFLGVMTLVKLLQ
jgi:uncharacterized membrane protein YfcA